MPTLPLRALRSETTRLLHVTTGTSQVLRRSYRIIHVLQTFKHLASGPLLHTLVTVGLFILSVKIGIHIVHTVHVVLNDTILCISVLHKIIIS